MDLLYLKLAQEGHLEPNFFCSSDYLQAIGAVEEKRPGGYVCVMTGEGEEQALFPPIHADRPDVCPDICDVWAGFANTVYPDSGTTLFLDHEFIYDPSRFLYLEGKQWTKFRKNSRKWMRRKIEEEGWDGPKDIQFVQLGKGEGRRKVRRLLEKWLGAKNAFIHDGEALLKCALAYPYRLALESPSSGRLWALNIWDYSWKYINYRWIIVDPGEPFLDECVRLLFYLEMNRRHPGILVNDGGSLDNAGLYRFKTSINPTAINKIYSWERTKE